MARDSTTGRQLVGHGVALSLLVLGVLGAPSAQGVATQPTGKSRADLVVVQVTAKPLAVVAGGTLRVTDTVRNRGRRAAGRTHTGYVLSTDRRLDRSDVALGQRRTGRLAPGRRARGGAGVRVPTTTPAGTYFVLACADHRGRTRESREQNNCRASRSRLRVTAAPTPPPPAPTPTPTPTPTPSPGPTPTPTPSPTPTPTPPPEPGGRFPWTPNPLDVTYAVDDEAATSRSQFTLSLQPVVATGADGTRYELVVPPGALASPVDLTMTPITDVSGASLTGARWGVELEPHGVAFLAPVTLTITPPTGTDLARASAFAFDEGGRDFHAHPATFESGSVSMQLFHFSSAGVGRPDDGAASPAVGRWPRRPSAQLAQRVAEQLDQERRDVQDGEPADPDLGQEVGRLFEKYEQDVVVPLLQQGMTCGRWAQARQGSQELVMLSRAGQLLTGEDPTSASTWQLMHDVWDAQADCLVRECVENHKVGAVLQLMALERQFQLLDGGQDGPLMDRLSRCLRFDLEVSSRHTSTTGWQDHGLAGGGGRFYYTLAEEGSWSGSSTIPLDLEPLYGLTGRGVTGLEEVAFSSVRTDVDGSVPDASTTFKEWSPGLSSALVVLDLNLYLPVWSDDWVEPDPATRTSSARISLSGTQLDALMDPGTGEQAPLAELYEHLEGGHRTTRTRNIWVDETIRAMDDLWEEPAGGRLTFSAAEQREQVFFSRSLDKEEDCAASGAQMLCRKTWQVTVRLVHTPDP